jgi:hypothetical protein
MRQSFTVLSSLPDASVCPSGEKETDHTGAECPAKMYGIVPFQSLMLLSLHPDASN